MPYLHDVMEQQRRLAEAPTLGNLHPDARAQAIARATFAPPVPPPITDAQRLAWLHSSASHRDAEGYEWGIFRVKWVDNGVGSIAEVMQTGSDFSDLDAAIRASQEGAQ